MSTQERKRLRRALPVTKTTAGAPGRLLKLSIITQIDLGDFLTKSQAPLQRRVKPASTRREASK